MEPWWRRVTGVTGGVAGLGLLGAASTLPTDFALVADVPRWQWLAVPWVLLLLVGPRRTRAGESPGPSRARAGGILVNATVGLVALAVSLVAAELAVRFAFRGVTSAADTRTYFNRPVVERNSLGFREREFRLAKPENTYRIVVLGDSLTWGIGVSSRERFSNLLEARLTAGRRADLTYEVLNFAQSGWDTESELAALRSLIPTAGPDFVLL